MNKVVRLGNLADTRRLLAAWDEVRQRILKGKTTGFSASIRSPGGDEMIVLGGVYKESPEDSLRAALRVSAELVKEECPESRFGS